MDEIKNETVEETTEELVTTNPEEHEEEDDDSAIGGLVALIGGGIAFGVGATAFALKVKDHFTKKRDQKRRKAEHDILMRMCPDGFEVVDGEDGPFYVPLEDDEPAPNPPEEKTEEK